MAYIKAKLEARNIRRKWIMSNVPLDENLLENVLQLFGKIATTLYNKGEIEVKVKILLLNLKMEYILDWMIQYRIRQQETRVTSSEQSVKECHIEIVSPWMTQFL